MSHWSFPACTSTRPLLHWCHPPPIAAAQLTSCHRVLLSRHDLTFSEPVMQQQQHHIPHMLADVDRKESKKLTQTKKWAKKCKERSIFATQNKVRNQDESKTSFCYPPCWSKEKTEENCKTKIKKKKPWSICILATICPSLRMGRQFGLFTSNTQHYIIVTKLNPFRYVGEDFDKIMKISKLNLSG